MRVALDDGLRHDDDRNVLIGWRTQCGLSYRISIYEVRETFRRMVLWTEEPATCLRCVAERQT